MTAPEPMAAPAAAIVQVEAAIRALETAALEAGVAFPPDRMLMFRRLVELLQSTQDLFAVVIEHAEGALIMDDPAHAERQHLAHLDVMAQHLLLARVELILSCARSTSWRPQAL